MFRRAMRQVLSLDMNGMLAIVFVLFCVYVGLAGIPGFLTNSGTALEEETDISTYIDTIDQQYAEMLGTEKETPLLQNKGTYINLNGLMARLLGQREIKELVKLNNGYLSWDGYSYSREELEEAFANIQKLAEKQTEQGKHFLFVMAPSKNYQPEKNFPVGYKDTSNDDVAYFFDRMEENNIAYLDLRKEMETDNVSYEDAFYVTDHHWTTQTGFWAYTKIVNALQKDGKLTEYAPFYLDPENYSFRIYEDSFLGSMGKRTGIYYAGLDDFCMIIPKYETDISVEIPGSGISECGAFESAAYNYSAMNILEEKDYFNDNPYGLYGWNDRPHTSWRNEHAPEHKKVMLIGNSYGNVPFAFMPLYFSSCEEVDMRHFRDDFTAYFDEYAPDIVILLVHLDNVVSTNTLYPFVQE